MHQQQTEIILGNRRRAVRAPTLSRIINQLKGTVTKHIGRPIWQKSYHDHIIRNEDDYRNTWQYIDANPEKWELDAYYTSE